VVLVALTFVGFPLSEVVLVALTFVGFLVKYLSIIFLLPAKS
jgi:hypothetical protein